MHWRSAGRRDCRWAEHTDCRPVERMGFRLGHLGLLHIHYNDYVSFLFFAGVPCPARPASG